MPAADAPISPARFRVSCAALAVMAAACAAYVSLVPFRFAVPAEIPSLVELLWTNGRVGGMLHGNGLANVVLFVPFGFFGLGALLAERSGWWRWVMAMLAVAAASVATSIGIEALQVFVPGRTPALADIVAQTVGTGVGFAGWMMLGREARVWASRFTTGHTSALRLALGIYTAIYALYLVLPLDVTVDPGVLAERFRNGRIVFDPMQSPALTWDLLPSLIADLVMAVPVGVFASLVGVAPGARRPPLRAFVLAALVFAAGEIAQVFVQSRTADVVDLAAALVGAAAGVGLAPRSARRRRPAVTAGRRARPVLVASLAAVTGLYVAYNWSPFDFNLSRDFIASRIGRFLAVPFAGYYQNAEFKALSDATIKLSISVPFGVLLQLLVRPDLSRRIGAA